MEINKLENLPDDPVPYEQIHDLMTTPKCGIGYVEPVFSLDSLSNNECIGFTLEWEGRYYGVYLHPEDGWTILDLVLDDIQEVFNDSAVDEAFALELKGEITEYYSGEIISYGGGVWLDAPPGVMTKLTIPHRPLSMEDLVEMQHSSIIEEIIPLYGVPKKGILAVCVEKSDLLSFICGNEIVFLYYNPEYGTWRVVEHDSISIKSDTADQYHIDTGRHVSDHFDNYEVLMGPSRAEDEIA